MPLVPYNDVHLFVEYSNDNKPKFNNSLPFWGNESSMNLNSLILTNIQSSTYFKGTRRRPQVFSITKRLFPEHHSFI